MEGGGQEERSAQTTHFSQTPSSAQPSSLPPAFFPEDPSGRPSQKGPLFQRAEEYGVKGCSPAEQGLWGHLVLGSNLACITFQLCNLEQVIKSV